MTDLGEKIRDACEDVFVGVLFLIAIGLLAGAATIIAALVTGGS